MTAAAIVPYISNSGLKVTGSPQWDCHQGYTPVPTETTKLLDSENVRTLMLRNNQACPNMAKWHDQIRIPAGGDFSSTGPPSEKGRVKADVVDPSEVSMLLELDTEELMRHTFRVQRERYENSSVRKNI